MGASKPCRPPAMPLKEGMEKFICQDANIKISWASRTHSYHTAKLKHVNYLSSETNVMKSASPEHKIELKRFFSSKKMPSQSESQPQKPPLLPMPAAPGYRCAQPRLQDLQDRPVGWVVGLDRWYFRAFRSGIPGFREKFVNLRIYINMPTCNEIFKSSSDYL